MDQLINMNLRKGFLVFLLCSIMVQRVSSRRGFFVVAHQANSKLALRISVNAGANAVEMDLQFDKTTGRPTHFYHGSPCDCTCYVVKNKINPFSNLKDNICRLAGPCTQKAGYSELLNYVLTFPSVALVYLDSKIDGLSTAVGEKAAKHLIETLNSQLFGKGYRGKVLIGSMQPSTYIRKLSEYAAESPYKARIYITIDDTHDDPSPVIKYMKSLHIPNIVVSNGKTACHWKNVPKAIEIAATYRTRGEVCSVFAWTIDKESSFDSYYRSRVNGILTNRVPALVKWAKKKNLRLATPGDDSLNCQEREVETCACNYQNGGCVVSLPAPKNRACHCNKKGSSYVSVS